MANKQNKICKVCGTKYSFCPSCSGTLAADKYKSMFCSENCRNIFYTCSRYNVGAIDKNKAKSILSDLDLSNRSNFSEKIKSDIANILKFKVKSARKDFTPVENAPIVVEEPIVENLPVTDESSTVVEENI